MDQTKQLAEQILQMVKNRLEKIDYQKDKYNCGISSFGDSYRITVKYDNIIFLQVYPYVSKSIKNGKKQLASMFFANIVDDVPMDILTNKNVPVSEKLLCANNEPFERVLESRIPIWEEEKKDQIVKVLKEYKIDFSKINYDTINCRYVIKGELNLSVPKIKVENNRVYKYMSLATFMEILKRKKFRLNSIVSMNDTSETFFLGDYVCDAYVDSYRHRFDIYNSHEELNGKRISKLLEYKNCLIGSFSSKEDDPILWERYGDKYRGICLGFNFVAQNLKPIIYSGNKNDIFSKLKKVATQLRQKNILIYFDFKGDLHFYCKHWQFEAESEYRMMKTIEDKDLEIDLYGDILSYYHDYTFDELGIKPVSLWIGANCPNQDVNIPILSELTKRQLGIDEIYISKCNKYRI